MSIENDYMAVRNGKSQIETVGSAENWAVFGVNQIEMEESSGG